MRSKGPSPQTMGKTCRFPIHIWLSDPSGSRQQQPYRVYWSRPGVLAGAPPGRAGQGPPGHHGDRSRLAAPRHPKPKPPAKAAPRPTRLRAPATHQPRPGPSPRRGATPAPHTAGPGRRAGPARCCPRFSLPRFPQATAGRGFTWGFRKPGLSARLGAFFWCFFPPARRLHASRIGPRYLCSAVMVP